MKKNIHSGSSFDDFLKEEGIFAHCQEIGAKYALVKQLQDKVAKYVESSALKVFEYQKGLF